MQCQQGEVYQDVELRLHSPSQMVMQVDFGLVCGPVLLQLHVTALAFTKINKRHVSGYMI